MIAKRYFSALVILLVFLGFYTKQNPVPNQEISLQFADQQMINGDAEDIIKTIKTTLQSVGVAAIQVRKQENGTLKIAYYSDAKVTAIKKILAAIGIHSNNDSGMIPISKKRIAFQDLENVDAFKLDVYEIQTVSNAFVGIHGKYILSLQKEYDKAPTSPNIFGNTSAYYSTEEKAILVVSFSESVYKSMLKEKLSYETPDVRAGPIVSFYS